MSASPAVLGSASGFSGRDDRMEVPMKWRIGQGICIALIVLLAVYYNLKGWQVPGERSFRPGIFDQVGFILLVTLVILTTPTAGVIASTTFQEAIRRRWMTALLGFALVIVCLSLFFTWMQRGEEEKFLRDFGVGFVIIITLLMSIFLGVALVPPEIERRTIFTVLSKPVERWEFIIGKFLGLAFTLFFNLAIMTVVFLIAYALYAIRRDPGGFAGAMAIDVNASHPGLVFNLTNLAKAMALHFGQLSIMAALALMLSLIVSNITAIVFCFIAYFGGQMSSYWEHLGDHKDEDGSGKGLSGSVAQIVKVVYLMLPRLDRFDVRERLVNDTPIYFNYMWKATGSGLIYVAVLLVIAYLVFSEREF